MKPGKTSRDVASALGIAQSTVSRAFTPGASISPDLRARIHAMAEAIGYRPNFLARGLVAGRSHLIGMVIAPQTNLLYPELLYELGRQLAEQGRQLLLLPAADEAAVGHAIERLRAYRVDAVLATGIIGEDVARTIVADGVPLVTFNRLLDSGVSGVSCDFTAGAAKLGERLLARGHRRFGFIGGPAGSWVSQAAERGLRVALASAPDADLASVQAPFDYASGAAALEQLLCGSGSRPTAIVCVNDTVAAGCLDHLRFGDPHRDVALVTFLARDSGAWAGYRLSGVAQPTARMIEAAVELLAVAGDPSRPPEQRLLQPTLVAGMTADLTHDRSSPGNPPQAPRPPPPRGS